MRIKINTRCEDTSHVSLVCESKEDAQKTVKLIQSEPHVLGSRLVACTGKQAFISITAKYQRDQEYTVHHEIGENLVRLGYASELAPA